MVTKNPRLNVVLDADLYAAIRKIAKKHRLSLSLIARDLLKEAVERYEDSYWQKAAAEREKSFSSKSALTHKDVWS
jgi:predicted transcriptional regulator